MHTILCKENTIEGAAQALFFYLKKKGGYIYDDI